MKSTTDIVKKRFLGFLIWQSIHSTIIFILFTTTLSQNGIVSLPSLLTCLSFLTFHLSLLLFSASLSFISSPYYDRPSSPYDLALALLRFLFSGQSHPQGFLRRARVFLGLFGFLLEAALAGTVALVSLCKSESCGGVAVVGLRGFGFGLVYGIYYVFKRRWVLEFPIIQRPLFFSFKMGLPSAIGQAVKLSAAAYIFSGVLILFLQDQFGSPIKMGNFILEQIIFYVGIFSVCLCWELSHHLHQVMHTKRYIFAPPKGSAAAETNPSEPLLAALEESTPKSLPRYLAYLDLCMVCDNNVDSWRRAAFFEETGETYKKVVAVCLRPLEHLASNFAEGLESSSVDKTYQQSSQLQLPTVSERDSRLSEPFNNSQLCAWCSWAVATLTARSHKEDRFGVAQLSGSNAAVISTLLSCLLAVETFLGKKTSLQSPNALMGLAAIKWATVTTARSDAATSVVGKKRGVLLHSQAYAIADVLRTSIYCIVSAFHEEMLTGAKAGLLEKDWIVGGKPLYGTRELLLQKLHLFLDF